MEVVCEGHPCEHHRKTYHYTVLLGKPEATQKVLKQSQEVEKQVPRECQVFYFS